MLITQFHFKYTALPISSSLEFVATFDIYLPGISAHGKLIGINKRQKNSVNEFVDKSGFVILQHLSQMTKGYICLTDIFELR